jgi:hypothetical protein
VTSAYHLVTVTVELALPRKAWELPIGPTVEVLAACGLPVGARPEASGAPLSPYGMGLTHRATEYWPLSRTFALRNNTPKAKGPIVGQNPVGSDNPRYVSLTCLGLGARRVTLGPTDAVYGAAMGYPYPRPLGNAHGCFTDRCDTLTGPLHAGAIRPYQKSVATPPHTTHTTLPESRDRRPV